MGRKSGVILSYILMVIEVLSTLLLTPFIIRSLGQAEFGVYKLVISASSYLLLLDLGIGNAVVRYVAKFKRENDIVQNQKFLGVCTIFYCTVALISILLGIILIKIFPSVFAKGLNIDEINLCKKLLVLTVANVAVSLAFSAFNYYLVGYSMFAVSRGASIILTCLRIGLTFIALEKGMGSVGIVTINLVITIISRLFFAIFVFVRLRLTPIFRGIDSKFIKEIVVYSSLILLQMIATQINAYVDQVLLGILVSGSSIIIGIYGVGSQISQYFQSIGSACSSVLMPGVVNLVEQRVSPDRLQDEMIKIGRITLSILSVVWIGFLVFGQQFIILWAGKIYIQAFYVAMLLISAYLLIYTESVGSQILWALNKHKEQAILKIIIVIVNVILTVILIKWNPIIGATIGTFISLILGDVVVMNVIFRKKIGIKLSKYYKDLTHGIAPCIIITLLASLVFSFLQLSGWFGFAVNICFMCTVYIASMWLFGFNSYEKSLICGMVRKVLKRSDNKSE
jgi:O-antigen/teichoic acid export membrane protein